MTVKLERKSFAEVKLLDTDSGGFEGYASLFGVKDSYGDTVQPGAFKDTLPQFIERGFIAAGHEWAGLPIGYVEDAFEDEKGLFIRVRYHSTDEAQAARKVAQERIAAGKFVGLSIGYMVAAGGATMKSDGRHLTKLDLFETSRVNVPALAPAGLTGVKSAEAAATEETPASVAEPEQKGSALGSFEQIRSRCYTALQNWLAHRSDRCCYWGWVVATYADAFIACLDTDDGESYLRFPYTIESDGSVTLGEPEPVEMTFVTTQTSTVTTAGRSDPAHAAVDELTERVKSLRTQSVKEGRAISTARRTRLTELRDQLRAGADDLDGLLTETQPKKDETGSKTVALRARHLALRTVALAGSAA